MISIRHWAFVLAVTCFGALCLCACGGEEEEAAKGVGKPEASRWQPGEELRYSGTTEEGERFEAQLGGEVTIPEGFPEDVPLLPGASPSALMAAGDTAAIMVLDTAEQPPAVYRFYKQELPANGWSIQGDTNIGSQRALSAVKGDRRATVVIEQGDEGVQVSISLTRAR